MKLEMKLMGGLGGRGSMIVVQYVFFFLFFFLFTFLMMMI